MTRCSPLRFVRRRLAPPAALLALAGALVLPATARAHRGLDEQIAALSQRIAAGASAELLLRRGELHRLHEDPERALADLARARELDPGLAAIDLARGQALLDLGRLGEARAALDRFLQERPDDPSGRLARARVLVRMREPALAAVDYDRALAALDAPAPSHFIERAEAWIAAGRPDAALRGVTEGIKRIGDGITLQTTALDLEIRLGRLDEALARVDTLSAAAARKEWWLARRAEILRAGGRTAEARVAADEALALIEKLPSHVRASKATRELAARLRTPDAGSDETPVAAHSPLLTP